MLGCNAKEVAAKCASDLIYQKIVALLKNKERIVIGVGTGSTVALLMSFLMPQMSLDIRRSIVALASSYQSQALIKEYGLNLGHLSEITEIDLGFDGADEVDASGSYCIKGGGGAQLMEKILASISKDFIIVVDSFKVTSYEKVLGEVWTKGIPLAVLYEATEIVMKKLKDLDFEPSLREGNGKMGPIITDQGHVLIDLKSSHPFTAPEELSHLLNSIPGIIEHGIFINMASDVIIGNNDGSYVHLHPKQGRLL